MRRFLNGCGHYRTDICLLASGVLTEGESASVENHLANCAGCRKYYDEVKGVAAPLANWEKAFSHIEPSQIVQARWTKDFQAATDPVHPRRSAHIISFLDWCHDLIWPCRRIWTGFAAVWLAILAINFSTRDTGQSQALKSSHPSPEMVRAFLEHEGFLAEMTSPGKGAVAEPPKPSSPPPRSERRLGILRA